MPKTTDICAVKGAESFFVGMDGEMYVPSLGGGKYVMALVDDCIRFKSVTFLETKSDATAICTAEPHREFHHAGEI